VRAVVHGRAERLELCRVQTRQAQFEICEMREGEQESRVLGREHGQPERELGQPRERKEVRAAGRGRDTVEWDAELEFDRSRRRRDEVQLCMVSNQV
jgi:hypothetical protein